MKLQTALLLLLILIISCISGVLIYNSLGQISLLQDENEKLEKEITALSMENVNLEKEISNLNSIVEELETVLLQYDRLQSDYEKLRTDYRNLQTDYGYLQTDYEVLDYYYSVTQDLKIGNSLTSYYDTLRYEFGPTGSKSRWYYEEESCKFAAQLALHDIHRLYWTKTEEIYGEDVGQESYAQAWEIIDKTLDYCDVYTGDSDIEIIENILDFITWYIDYEPEMDDSVRAPVETLNLRSGDCDDFTILAAALFDVMGVESAIGFFQNDYGEAHAMTLVHLDDLGDYGYWYFDDLTDFDLMEGDWIVIEPQRKIDEQHYESMTQWEIYMAVEIDYDKATS
jgi:hypothetical protein